MPDNTISINLLKKCLYIFKKTDKIYLEDLKAYGRILSLKAEAKLLLPQRRIDIKRHHKNLFYHL